MSEVGPFYAFWPYDLYPYFLGGKITRTRSDGMVQVEGFGESWINPKAIVAGAKGYGMLENLKILQEDCREAIGRVNENFKNRLESEIPTLAVLGYPGKGKE